MISAAGIPVIEGDMDALAAHARALSTTGSAFADTGARVNATWQGLAGVYDAPEVAQLLTATAPVQSISGSLGADIEAVGAALGGYASEVREIKARLEALRAQAGGFEAAVAGDDDWTDDDAHVERNNELVAAVKPPSPTSTPPSATAPTRSTRCTGVSTTAPTTATGPLCVVHPPLGDHGATDEDPVRQRRRGRVRRTLPAEPAGMRRHEHRPGGVCDLVHEGLDAGLIDRRRRWPGQPDLLQHPGIHPVGPQLAHHTGADDDELSG